MFELNSNNYLLSAKEEYYSLKNGAGIFPLPDSVIMKLTGKDTLDFLHRISTNSLNGIKHYEKKNTLFLNEKGRFIDKAALLNLENYFLLIGSPDKDKRLFNWVNKFIIMEDIQTEDLTTEYLVLEVSGPQSESYLMLLIGDDIKNLNTSNIIYTHADGFNFYLYQYDESGTKNYRILIESVRANDFIEYMLQNKSVFDVNLIGKEAHEILRVENGTPTFPNEINDNFNPHETNLIHDVNFNKGCYIGQEVIARLDTYDKVQRKITGVILPDEFEPNGTLHLLDSENNDAGIITSTVDSELLNKTIGLGLIKKKSVDENDQVFIKLDGKKVPVTLCDLPFRK